MNPGKDKELKDFDYQSAETLLKHGPDALHEHIAARIESSLGRALPQMEVRFQNLSLSADVVVSESNENSFELPTLVNTVKKAFAGPKKHVVHKEILKNVSGSFRPGTMTLLLGQAGSGKSAFMKILSGRFPMTKNITMEGNVTYNSVPRAEVLKQLPQFVAYVGQRDLHFPMLTVKETLEFAHAFTGGELSRRGEELLTNGTAEENSLALAAVRAMFDNYQDLITRQLGLKVCENTVVGDTMVRGISGGERKRVTTGEMEFGMKYMTLMDEISTGLDSAATFDIISTQ